MISIKTNTIYDHGYGQLPKAIMLDFNLTNNEKLLLCFFISYAGNKNICFPSYEMMAKYLRMSKKTISNIITSLCNKKYILKEKTDYYSAKLKCNISHNTYTFLFVNSVSTLDNSVSTLDDSVSTLDDSVSTLDDSVSTLDDSGEYPLEYCNININTNNNITNNKREEGISLSENLEPEALPRTETESIIPPKNFNDMKPIVPNKSIPGIITPKITSEPIAEVSPEKPIAPKPDLKAMKKESAQTLVKKINAVLDDNEKVLGSVKEKYINPLLRVDHKYCFEDYLTWFVSTKVNKGGMAFNLGIFTCESCQIEFEKCKKAEIAPKRENQKEKFSPDIIINRKLERCLEAYDHYFVTKQNDEQLKTNFNILYTDILRVIKEQLALKDSNFSEHEIKAAQLVDTWKTDTIKFYEEKYKKDLTFLKS